MTGRHSTPTPFMTANAPANEYLIAMHLIGVHANAAAVHCDWKTNFESHWREHTGPGGLRNHHYASLHFDANKVEAVLEKAENEDRL